MAGGCYSSSLAQRIDAGEGAVAICGSVLGVENADEVEGHKA